MVVMLREWEKWTSFITIFLAVDIRARFLGSANISAQHCTALPGCRGKPNQPQAVDRVVRQSANLLANRVDLLPHFPAGQGTAEGCPGN